MARVSVGGGGGGGGPSGPVCPEGTWPATIIDAGDESSRKERDLAIHEDREPQPNMSVIDFSVRAQGADYTIRTWIPFGVPFRVDQLVAAFPAALDDGMLDTDLLRGGMRCDVSVIHEIYRGTTKAKIGKLFPSQDSGGGEDDQCPF